MTTVCSFSGITDCRVQSAVTFAFSGVSKLSAKLKRAVGYSLLAWASFISIGCPSTMAHAQVAKLDQFSRRIIAGSTHPLAKSAFDVGPVDPNAKMERMLLVLGATAEQEHELRTLIDSQHTKGSPNYHQWLNAEEFANRFGPALEDIQKVKGWLQQRGFSVTKVGRGGRWLEFSGSAAQVESAFQTQMRQYQVGGRIHTANATNISIPSELSLTIRGILSLHDFTSKPMVTNQYTVRRDSSGSLVPVDPNFTLSAANGTFHYLVPNDYGRIYDLSSLYKAGFDGSGQTIAIVARSRINLADVDVFRRAFNLPFNDPNVIISGPDPGFTPDSVEASLDVEWAGAVAPKAIVDLVISASTTTTDGVALSVAYIVDNNLAGVMSVSFNECERNLGTAGNSFFNALWQQAAAQGISVFVAAGDNGAAGCDVASDPNNVPAQNGLAVNGLASTPFNTAVGGVQFAENGNDSSYWNPANAAGFSSAIGYIPESIWNESCDPTKTTTCPNNVYSLFAGSGGASQVYPKPSWQSGSGVPADGHRDVPDISLAAAGGHVGYLICYAGSCLTTPDGNLLTQATVIGGTSASAPSFAGLLTLINEKLGARQGLATYVLYPLASKENFANCNSSSQTDPTLTSQCVFNDITSGNNSVPGVIGFTATTGFDLASGLGSVNAANLANAWALSQFQGSTTALTVPTTSASHGQPVQITVNVTASSGNGSPTGTFALMSDKYSAEGSGTLSNGSFTGSFSSLPGGQYNVFAHYAGDGTFGSSDSAPVPVNIGQESSKISLGGFTYGSTGAFPASSVPYGNFLYLHAAVASASGNGVATGTVTYNDGSTVLGTITLNSNGEGELVSGGFTELGAVICLSVGSHNITATYSGDNSLVGATSQPFSVIITQAAPVVFFLNETALTVPAGQQVALVAFVGPNGPILPTGTLQFLDGTTALGPAVPIAPVLFPSKPQGSLQVTLPPGAHTINVRYSGDQVYTAAGLMPPFTPISVTVTTGPGTPTQTSLTSSSGAANVGDVLNYIVKVTSSAASSVPTGTIQLYEPGIGPPIAPVNLQNGTATIPIQWSFAGPHALIAQYSGDSNFAFSVRAPFTVSVGKATPSITLTSSSAQVRSSTQVNFTAQVSTSLRPIVTGLSGLTGQVQFFDSLNRGPAQPLGVPVFLLFLTTDPAVPGLWGFVMSAALPATLPDGTHVVTAQYLGSSSYNSVTSSSVSVVVGARSATQTALSVDSANPTFGQVVNFSAKVTSTQSSPIPTGNVQLFNPGVGVLATSSLQNGSATFALPWNVGGFQTAVAQYSGDSNYASSQSSPLIITVPSFEFTAGDNQLAIPAGNGAAVFLRVTPLAGFHSMVTLACGSGVPAGSTCSILPSSVPMDGVTAANATFVLSTIAASPSTSTNAKVSSTLWWTGSFATGLAALVLIVFPARRTNSRYFASLLLAGLLVGVGACGGGGGGSSGAGGGGNGGGSGGGGGTPVPTSTMLNSSAIRQSAGGSVAFTATVTSTASSVTGTVTFYDGVVQIGQSAVSGDKAQLTVKSLSVGTHSISAKYSGDSQNSASTSTSLNELITGNLQFPITATAGAQIRTIVMNVLLE